MPKLKTNDITSELHGQHLQVKMNGQNLFALNRPLSEQYQTPYQLTLDKEGDQYIVLMQKEYYHDKHRLYVTDSAELASSILNVTSEALSTLAMRAEAKKKEEEEKQKQGHTPALAFTQHYTIKPHWLIVTGMVCFVGGLFASLLFSPSSSVEKTVTTSPIRQSQQSYDMLSRDLQPVPLSVPASLVSQPVQAPQPIEDSTLSPTDMSDARQILAQRLKNGAAKQIFTISLSSGHPRTLYLFADPECTNCRIFEPTIQALANHYNVEIFPVTLIGKGRTSQQIVPMLCAPADKRAAMWRSLFDHGAGMLKMDTQSSQPLMGCEAALNALARNDLAFELYKLPGTPTIISDDGRLIPLQAMTSDTALQAFLNSAQ